ncbi:MAG: hypothetical protein M3340_01925 [Actinomycetota bacterium]|nr:hypothetical protein [Actinomycetota bacterium]
MRRRALSGCLLVVPLILGIATDAAARGPVYRDPPSYRGITKAPKATPPPQARVALSATGASPDVIVDDAGTAHIVWNEGRGDDSDAAVYCRLKRGATDCDTRATLTWEKSYDSGDGPQFNTDYIGPKIARVGDQIVVLSKRYPTVADKPDGASSNTVVAWVSNDGGTTWPNAANPAAVGKHNLGQLAVLGPPDDPTILNIAQDPFCGMCVEAYKSGQYTGGAGNLAVTNDQAYNGGVALGPDGVPIAGFTDANANAFARRWSGQGSIQDPGTWSPAAGFRGEALTLAGGPAGVYAMAKPELVGGPFEVRRLGVDGGGAVTPGDPTTVSDAEDVIFGRIAQDPSGRAIAAWSRRGGSAPGVVQRLASAGSLSFGEAERLIDGQQNGQIAIGAAFDGGGFTVFNHTGGCCDAGEIVAAGFGNPGPTGRQGLGQLAGGGIENVTCQSVKFGSFTVDTAAGCFLQGAGSGKGKVVSGNEIELNGLRIVPDAGVKIVIDPKALRIDTTGDVRVIATAPVVGDFVLWHGSIHRDLGAVRPGSNLFEFAAGEFDANLFGFDLAADLPVRLERDGVRIPVDVELPKVFGGFTGHAELIARKGQGLTVDSLDIHIGPVPLGVLVINAIDLKYTGATDTWEGSGSITVPAGGTIEASARFIMGEFERASIDFTPATPIPVGPFVYLIAIGGGFEVKPAVHIEATARFGLGAAVNGESPVGVNGKFEMTFPSSGPAHFKLSGTVSVLLFEAGNAFLEFYTDGYAAFGGQVGPLELGPLNVEARLGGFVDAGSGKYGASLDGKIAVCAPVLGCGDTGVEFALNDQGFAVCADIGPLRAGVRFPWDEFDPLMLVSPLYAGYALATHFTPDCNTNGYRTPPPRGLRKAQGGGVTVDVPANLPSETIFVRGEGENGRAPRVAVTGPNGQSFNSDQASDAGMVVYARGIEAAYVLLEKPAGGAWTVTPMEGSPNMGEVKLGDGYLPATVSAKLGGRGSRRSIAYRVARAGNGQVVRFAERGAFGTRLLGATTKSRGTVSFTPVDARGRKRTVVALIEKDGIVTDEVRVGSFTAPAPARPGAPSRLKASRKVNRVTVSWRPGKGAKSQIVRLRGRHTNLARLVSSKTRRMVFTAVRRDERVTIEVRGVSARQRQSAVRKVRVGAAR